MKSFVSSLISLYLPSYPRTLVYMLQASEYRTRSYLRWFHRTKNFHHVAYRRRLEMTNRARMLLLFLSLGMLVEIVAGFWLVYLGIARQLTGGVAFGAALVVGYPVVWAYLAVVMLEVTRFLFVRPKERKLIASSERIFRRHKGCKIAIAGSYGKTTQKELLLTVLSEAKNVAATPGNQNVPISHSRFARTLSGKEDIVLIEYGEGAPGDIARFCRVTHPTCGIITGLAPAHLDQYKSLKAAAADIFSLADCISPQQLYVNTDSALVRDYLPSDCQQFSANGVLGWRIDNVKLQISGTSFDLIKGKRRLKLHSGLLGRHQLGPLGLTAALADQFGLSSTQIEKAIAKTRPFEHRLQPYPLNGGWVLDDTYNGNIEGIRAGTALLAELPAQRKLYVTPGLVDQGEETESVHRQMGHLIAAAQPDVVVLMQNSVTGYIQEGLKAAEFSGEIRLEDDPLSFYTNLDQFLASGDLILMQNDWTDNYF